MKFIFFVFATIAVASNSYGEDLAVELAQLIEFKTVANETLSPENTDQFKKQELYLLQAYKPCLSNLEKIKTNSPSLLFYWPGTNPKLKPGLLAAHLDVVPIANTKAWSVSPFSGKNDGKYLWGRGSLDNKSALASILNACSKLIVKGFQPKRGIYLAFGHDEEIGGANGAAKMAQIISKRDPAIEFVLDEGGYIVMGDEMGLNGLKIGLVGIAEKGFLNIKLEVEQVGGHSSLPQKQNAISTLSEALKRIHNNPFPGKITGAFKNMLETLAPHFSPIKRLFLNNLWFSERLLVYMFSQSPSTNALLRTTVVPTIISSGIKENVIPSVATANLNLRLLPGTTIESAVEHITKVIHNSAVKVTAGRGRHGVEPSHVSPIDNWFYKAITTSIKKAHGQGTVLAPYVLLGGSDARHYAGLTKNIYRMTGLELWRPDRVRLHGVDERVSLENLEKQRQFYLDIISVQ